MNGFLIWRSLATEVSYCRTTERPDWNIRRATWNGHGLKSFQDKICYLQKERYQGIRRALGRQNIHISYQCRRCKKRSQQRSRMLFLDGFQPGHISQRRGFVSPRFLFSSIILTFAHHSQPVPQSCRDLQMPCGSKFESCIAGIVLASWDQRL